MTSYLIVGKDAKEREKQIHKLCEKEQILSVDIMLIEREFVEGKPTKQSLGIEEVKIMQKKLFLKPLRSAQKAVILKEAQLLTIEAQNALLKVLEEPPEQTIIILSADSEEALLPTIRSRCQIIQLPASRILLTPEEEKAYTETVQELRHLTIGKALSLSEKLAKNKEETAVWLEKLILFLRAKMLQAARRKDKEMSFYVTLIQLAQQAYQTVLHTNVNKRIVLEQFFFSLVSSS